MHSDGYYFGTTLAKRVDYFAFPRTGSHFLWTSFTGLFDLVFFPNQFVENPEAKQRTEELNPLAVYAMKLREDGVPIQPVYINAAPQGVHGGPVLGDNPVIILIRNPHPTLYSWYHTATDRWGARIDDIRAWLKDGYRQYAEFYDRALAMQQASPERVHWIRYEQLKDSAAVLAETASFVGVRPKLSPEFVFEWTRFDRMTRSGPRSFYRVGNNAHWQNDPTWREHLRAIGPGDFSRFGYPEAV
ncbi:MAG TPA: sulfotransferase domain-containing protein [Opitutaceae bacterium]|nr:sulfotransferase domain-containing protein [Opitutaceae bacterium]